MQLEKEIPDVDIAVQFLFTIAGSDENVEGRPKDNPSVTEVHAYSLRTLIRDSAKIGRDAGIYMYVPLLGNHIILQLCRVSTGPVFSRSDKAPHPAALQPFCRALCPVPELSTTVLLC